MYERVDGDNADRDNKAGEGKRREAHSSDRSDGGGNMNELVAPFHYGPLLPPPDEVPTLPHRIAVPRHVLTGLTH